MKFYIPLLVGICIAFCVQSNIPGAYGLVGMNVREADPRRFSFVASLMHLDVLTPDITNNHICTAAMLTHSHALTAYHCIANRHINETVVSVGSVNLIDSLFYELSWWINYDQWSEFKNIRNEFDDNDISVMKLNGQIDRNIVPGVLSPLRNADLYGHEAVIAGWGVGNDGEVSDIMLSGTLRFLRNRECEQKVRRVSGESIAIHERYLCTAAYPYILLHYGDNGGPVFYNNMIVGINKETIPFLDIPVHSEKVNIHTGIDYYREFITDTIRRNFQWY